MVVPVSRSTLDENKKRKLAVDISPLVKPKSSKIFSPFRVIGHVSNGIPFAIGSLGTSFYIATVTGKSFQIYDISTLHLLFVSNVQTKSPITSITAHFHFIYVSYGNKIGIFRRGKLELELSIPNDNDNENINKVITFGNYLIASTDSSLHIFEKSTIKNTKYPTEYYTSIKINSLLGEIVDIIHLPTYINKIIVATKNHLLIYNIRTTKLLYTSNEFIDGITCIESAPALDIIAIGNHLGKAIIMNIKKGKIINEINTGSNCKITSISFRTDGLPHLVCSLTNGDLFFYDLNKKSRVHILRNAHKENFGGVTKVSFLNGQPIIVTTGPDNSLKEFVFDPILSNSNTSIISPPRHLRSRGGHSSPPTSIIFADSKSHFIQSASQDKSFWTFSLRKDAQSQEMSQKQSKLKDGKRQSGLSSNFKDKFPPITCIAQENSREGEWDNIITGHEDESFARTWDSKNKKIGKYQLSTIDNGIVKSVSITQCGNFALIGSSLGGIGCYNLQSGKLRKIYKLHKKSVTGIAVDGMNRKMVSCGLDGLIGFYDFSKSTFLGKLKIDSPITKMIYHKSSDLIALACDDLSIIVIDTITQKIIRQLFGHTNRITSLDFSPNGRWIISSSLDATIRTWDVPTGGCIDGIIVPNVATEVKFSPLGDYLATTHVNGVGISLWTNKSQFKPISTKNVEISEFATIMLPNISGEGGSNLLDGAFDGDGDGDDDEELNQGIYKSLDQIDSELLTLSLGPRSKFNTLLHLDNIKFRNKLKEAPKKQENIPFFLQLSGEKVGDRAKLAEEGGGNTNKNKNNKDEPSATESRLLKLSNDTTHTFESEFTLNLRESSSSSNKDYSRFVEYLVNLSPSSLDLEIRSLNTMYPFTELISFIEALIFGLNENKNYDIILSLMHMLLNVHGDVIFNAQQGTLLEVESNDVNEVKSIVFKLLNTLNEFKNVSNKRNERLDSLIKYCSGVVNFISST